MEKRNSCRAESHLMSKMMLLLTAFLAFSAIAQNTWVPFTSHGSQPSVSTISRSQDYPKPTMTLDDKGKDGVEFEYQFPGALLSEEDIDGVLYQLLRVDQFNLLNNPGKPALPARWFTVAVPDGMSPEIEILEIDTVVFSGYTVRPARQPAYDYIGAPEPEFIIDEETYNSDANYPATPVGMAGIRKYRGKQLAKIQVCPVLHNPVGQTLTAFTKLRFKINFKQSDTAVEESKQFAPHHAKLLSNSIGNPDAIDIPVKLSSLQDAITQIRGGLLILTTPAYEQAADTLASWKRLMGYDVSVISRADWTSSSVKDTIHSRYASANPMVEFCVILGDHPDVPSEHIPTGYNPHVSDLYYACMDGPGDFTPDIGIGRISVSNASEALTVVLKIVNYERSPVIDQDFYRHGLAAAYFQHAGNGYAERRFAQTSWEIRQYLINSQGYTIDREFVTGSSVYPTNWNNGTYSSGEPIPTYLQKPNYAWDGDAAGISTSINAGRFLVSHRDHGGTTVWGDPYYTTSHISALTNGDKLPVVLSINCLTGKFDYSSPCFSEVFLRHPSGGAVGVVSATEVSMSGQNDGLAVGIIDGIWSDPGLVPLFPHNTNPSVTPHDPIYHMGLVLNHGKMRMSETWNGGSAPFNYEQYTYELFHYLGDPSMQIWTDVPAMMSVSASNAILIGQTNFEIQNASCSEGVATLMFDGQIIGKCDLSNGSGTMTLNPAPITTGTALLTITSHNYRPYQMNIDVLPPGDAIIPTGPVAGSLFDIGEQITATWQTFGDIAQVNIEFSSDGGNSYTLLAASVPNTDSYTFTAPSVESDSCLVRIGDTDGDPNGVTALFSIHDLSTISGTVAGGTTAEVFFTGPMTGSVVTDGAGAYAIAGLTPGAYVLRAQKGAYQSGQVTVTLPPDTTVDFSIDYPEIAVSPGSLRSDLVSGDADTLALMIENNGNALLDYTISGADVLPAISKRLPSVYDARHYEKLAKGAEDTRVGIPVAENQGGPDQFGYRWIDSDEPGGPTFSWDDISQSGTRLSSVSNCDDCYQSVSLSFSFPFYDADFSSLYVSSNGYITLGSGTNQISNYPLPGTDMPPNLIAAFFDDLYPGSIGDIYFEDFGDRAVVQFDNVGRYSGSGTYTYQMVLTQSGEIRFNYLDIGGTNRSTTIGIQNSTRDVGLEIAYNTDYCKDSLAVSIRSMPGWLSLIRNSGSVEPGARDTVGVVFSAVDMNPGTFTDSLSITHNAPTGPAALPCTLVVDGVKRLASSLQQIDFGNIWVGRDSSVSFTLINAGTEPTNVTAIDLNSGMFSIQSPTVPFVVPFQGQTTVSVSCRPAELGTQNRSLVITSDAEDNPLISIPLTGSGTQPPMATLAPDTLHFTLAPNDLPADKTSVLANVGGDTLSYQITSVQQTSSPLDARRPFVARESAIDLQKVYDSSNYENPFVPGRVIVGFKKGADTFTDNSVLDDIGTESLKDMGIARIPETGRRAFTRRKVVLVTIKRDDREGVIDAIERLRYDPNVAYAEPDYQIQLLKTPNDPYFTNLYGLHNTGQTGGVADADIDAPEAWDSHTGNKSILIGVLDTGIDYLHPDLAANIWTNPGEIAGNGIDDDGNGYIDDIYGWDFSNDDNDPADDHDHGTHCAGTIGAVGNDSLGVVGVMWDAQIMAIKIFNSAGGMSSASDAFDGIVYANAMGVDLVSNSWGVPYSAAMQDAIADGGLYVFAAGNAGSNNDINPSYPASYPLDNIIAVAATDDDDALAGFSCYGPTSVDLGAPGVAIYSCAPGGAYQNMSGTSMATPHVAGAAGLVWTKNPSLSVAEVKSILLESIDSIPSLDGMVLTGGRLNVARAIERATPPWILASPLSPATIAPADSQDISVTVNPAGLIEGQWAGEIVVSTDDPINPELTLQVVADIAGCKSLVSSADSLDMGTVWTGQDTTLSFVVANSCNDTVTIQSMSINNAAFTTSVSTPLEVLPFDAIAIPVTYSPSTAGSHIGEMIVESDADDNPMITVAFEGRGIQPPVIGLSPSSFSETLNAGDSLTRTMTIENSGGAPLECSLEIVHAGDNRNVLSDSINAAIRSAAGTDVLSTTTEEFEAAQGYSPQALRIESGNNVLLFRDQLAWGFDVNVPILESLGVSVTVAGSAAMDTIDMSRFDVVIIESVQGSTFYSRYRSNIARFEQYLHYGGNLQFNSCTQGDTFTLPGGMDALYGTSPTNYVVDRDHPVTTGIDSTLPGSSASHVYFQNLPDNAEILTIDHRGYPTTVEYTYGSGVVLATGMTWEFGYQRAWTSADLLPNAYTYITDVNGQQEWLRVSESSFTVAPDSSFDLSLFFNASGLLGGQYLASFSIAHNAPDAGSPLIVPCTLSVNGFRRLSVTPGQVDFGSCRIGLDTTVSIALYNDGSDIVTVDSLVVFSTEFQCLHNAPFQVEPFDTILIPVSYAPIDTGADTSALVIYSDAEDNPALAVDLHGTGVSAPAIEITPPGIARTLVSGAVATEEITVNNIGGDDLHYEIEGTADESVVINEFCNSPDFIELWNRGNDRDLSGWRIEWIDDAGSSDYFIIPEGFILPAEKRLVLRESSGTPNDTTLYYGYNIGWVTSSDVSIALIDNNGNGVDFVRTIGSSTTPPAGTSWSGAVSFSSYSAYRNRNDDTDSSSDWSNSSAHSMHALNPGQEALSLWPFWLTVTPTEGTVPGGSAQSLILQFDAGDLDVGTYQTTLRVFHNGTNEPNPAEIAVVLDVTDTAPGVSRIISVGPSASSALQGTIYNVKDIRVGSASSGIARGSEFTLILQ